MLQILCSSVACVRVKLLARAIKLIFLREQPNDFFLWGTLGVQDGRRRIVKLLGNILPQFFFAIFRFHLPDDQQI